MTPSTDTSNERIRGKSATRATAGRSASTVSTDETAPTPADQSTAVVVATNNSSTLHQRKDNLGLRIGGKEPIRVSADRFTDDRRKIS